MFKKIHLTKKASAKEIRDALGINKEVTQLVEHIINSECWCRPRRTYKDKETGAEVWVHHLKRSKRKTK